jgi:hypothetical protein
VTRQIPSIDITIGDPARKKLTITRRQVDPELDTEGGDLYTLQTRRPPAHRAPGRLGGDPSTTVDGRAKAGPECVCAHDAQGSCVAMLPVHLAHRLAEWACFTVFVSPCRHSFTHVDTATRAVI